MHPNSSSASKEWHHWHTVFTNYIEDYKSKIPNWLRVFVICVSLTMFEFIKTCTDYDTALVKLDTIFIKTSNEIFERHLLPTRKQKPSETLDDFFRGLKKIRWIAISKTTAKAAM